jgi:hypothetical protein
MLPSASASAELTSATITLLRYGRKVSWPRSTKMYFQAWPEGWKSTHIR